MPSEFRHEEILVVTARCRPETYDIWYYVATESGRLDIADRFIESVAARFLLLARHPSMGRTREDLRLGLRSFPVGEYVIIYRIQDEGVLILRVLHGSRDIVALFGK